MKERRYTKKVIVAVLCVVLITAAFLLSDLDADGLPTWKELAIGSNPINPDTSNSGLTDGELYYHGFDPTRQNLDPDRDHLPNRYEKKYGTDPFSKDTDHDGINDADEVFSYPHILNPLKPDAEKLLSKIPNVEAKLWPFFTEERINLNNPNAQDMFVIYGGYIAPNDPLVKYYAAHTKIKWTDHGHGQLFIDGERFFLKYDYEKMESGGQPFNPAYMLSHGRQGICIDAAIMSCSVLKAKGYPSIVVAGTVKPDLGHSWTETYINGRVYVVDFNRVIPREEAYYSGKYWYVLAKSMSDDDAYQTSYPNITHEYNSEWYKVYV